MILLVDDDESVTASLALLLKQAGYKSCSAASPDEALLLLNQEKIKLVIQDMNFSRETSGAEGLELLRNIKLRWPQVPVLLLTAWGSISLAVQGMKAGASDFVSKPWNNQLLLQSVQTALSLAVASVQKTEMDPNRQELDAAYDFQNLVGCDPKFLRVLRIIGRISGTDASVLITGESGTGKELVAEAIHRNSHRKQGPFVKVNLGGIPSTLFESEMFGHVKGAFTDARQDRKGRFELADGGTIFLDEIGELDLSSQVKMLRVLQDRTFAVLGSSVSRRVDVRVVSATNQNLADLVGRGEFREDLLYRLNLIAVHLPSLRERRDDILPLAHHFLKSMSQVYRRQDVAVSASAAEWLKTQPWPGNIRQLKHLLERAMLVSNKTVLEIEDFSLPEEMESEESTRDFLPPAGKMTLDEMEKAMIVQSLQKYSGNISKVAEALGLSRPALYRRMEKYGLIS